MKESNVKSQCKDTAKQQQNFFDDKEVHKFMDTYRYKTKILQIQ